MLKLVYFCLHNLLDDIQSLFVKRLKSLFAPFRKRALLHEVPALALAGVAVVFVSGSVAAAAHVISTHNNTAQSRQLADAQNGSRHGATSKDKVDDAKDEKSKKLSKQKADSTDRTNPQDTNSASMPTKSFTTAITHNGQVKAGALIAYDANKDTRTYYAGDYSFSDTTVVVHKGTSLSSASFTVSTPDDAAANFPGLSSGQNSSFSVSPNSSTDPSNSWNMAVQISSATPNGTYQVHLTSTRAAQSADTWEYDGFITVVVED